MGEHITTGQAARICSVTPDTVLKWIRAGQLRARRTAGGHHRIDRRDLERFLAPSWETTPIQEHSAGEAKPKEERHSFRYCWEFNGNGGVRVECLKCAVYLMRAQRCYEVAALAPEAVHGKLFCDGGCLECAYYREVHGQLTNVLVVTKDAELATELHAGTEEARFNIEIVDCEYNCSAVVSHFKPDFAIVDCDLGPEASRDISYHLVQDPRIPFVRVILAGSKDSIPRECDSEVFARIDRPFNIRDIGDCVSGFKDGVQSPNLGGG